MSCWRSAIDSASIPEAGEHVAGIFRRWAWSIYPRAATVGRNPRSLGIQPNQMMTVSVRKTLPPCSIIRPTATAGGGAVAAIEGFVRDGLFIGHTTKFTELLLHMAVEADRAKREL
jgi:hypothetical protein